VTKELGTLSTQRLLSRWWKRRWAYALAGASLGLGAPAGAFLLRLLLNAKAAQAPLSDLRLNAYFYLYQLIGTCLVFSIVGFLAGRRTDHLQRAEEFYHQLSEQDELTGLSNARAFHGRYVRAIERARRHGEPLSLLLIDVDRLKMINDRYGHAAGSEALRRAGRALQSARRQDDLAARWGGDEFALVMEGADEAAAIRVGNAILDDLRSQPMPDDQQPLTVTIGVATSRGELSAEALFDAADQALYGGKTKGRNRLNVASVFPRSGQK
jgi:diguanylate cyclase (GGDEF)-like protein